MQIWGKKKMKENSRKKQKARGKESMKKERKTVTTTSSGCMIQRIQCVIMDH